MGIILIFLFVSVLFSPCANSTDSKSGNTITSKGFGLNIAWTQYMYIDLSKCNAESEWEGMPSQHFPCTEKQWNQFLDLLDFIHPNIIRLWYGFTFGEPKNGYRIWEKSEKQLLADGFPNHAAHLKAVYRLLDHYKKNIGNAPEIQISFSYLGPETFSADGTVWPSRTVDNMKKSGMTTFEIKDYYNSLKNHNGIKFDLIRDVFSDKPFDLEYYADHVASFTKHLQIDKKYSFVKYISLYNELETWKPSMFNSLAEFNSKNVEGALIQLYAPLHKKLLSSGLREKVKIVGFESEIPWSDWDDLELPDEKEHPHRIKDFLKSTINGVTGNELVDIFSSHDYYADFDDRFDGSKNKSKTINGKTTNYNETVRYSISKSIERNISIPRNDILQVGRGQPIVFGEFGSHWYGGKSDFETAQDFDLRLHSVWGGISLLKAGAQWVNFWIFNSNAERKWRLIALDSEDSYTNLPPVERNYIPQSYNYYPIALASQYIESGSIISNLISPPINLSDSTPKINGLVSENGNNLTFLAVNREIASKAIEIPEKYIAKLDGKKLTGLYVNNLNDNKIQEIKWDNGEGLHLPARSIVVYTTLPQRSWQHSQFQHTLQPLEH